MYCVRGYIYIFNKRIAKVAIYHGLTLYTHISLGLAQGLPLSYTYIDPSPAHMAFFPQH